MDLYKYGLLLLASCALPFITGCTNKKVPNLQEVIENAVTDFHASHVSYLIKQDGKVLGEHFGDNNQANTKELTKIMENFSAPVLLEMMVSDSVIKEDSSLNKILPFITGNKVYPNDLITVPANLNQPRLQHPDDFTAAIRTVIEKTKTKKAKFDLNRFARENLKIAAINNVKDLFTGLSSLSDFFDANHPEYILQDTSIDHVLPTWYTSNINYFYGWNVFKLERQTILWNYYNAGPKSVLLLKFMDASVFVAVSYDSKYITTPFDYHKKDLLQCPFAIALVKAVLIKKKTTAEDYGKAFNDIYNNLQKQVSSPYYFLYLKELINYARFYKQSGQKKKAGELYAIYYKAITNKTLPEYLNKNALAGVDYAFDNMDVTSVFKIDKDTDVQVFSSGQAIATAADFKTSSWQYDNIQLFTNKNTNPALTKPEDNRSFTFNYKYSRFYIPPDLNTPDGWSKDTTVKYAFSDPSDTTYIMEAKIPWKALNYPKPTASGSIGVNFFIGDADVQENQRESVLSWTVHSNEYWLDPNKFGQLILSNKVQKNQERKSYSIKVAKPPKIDGFPDVAWDLAAFSDIRIPFIGNPSPSDNSARFKSLYDDKNLYLLFYITDNCKNPPAIKTLDKCWIEDARSGEVIWKTHGKLNKHSASFFETAKIRLKKGVYNLRYTSDGGNSFESGWYGKQPENGFYGAYVYKSNL